MAPDGNPQGYLKNDPAAVNKGSGVSGAVARSARARCSKCDCLARGVQEGVVNSKLFRSGCWP